MQDTCLVLVRSVYKNSVDFGGLVWSPSGCLTAVWLLLSFVFCLQNWFVYCLQYVVNVSTLGRHVWRTLVLSTRGLESTVKSASGTVFLVNTVAWRHVVVSTDDFFFFHGVSHCNSHCKVRFLSTKFGSAVSTLSTDWQTLLMEPRCRISREGADSQFR